MAVPKIILYYAFTPIEDPEAIKLWQRDLAELLGLRGRILISPHGINGTLGGDIDSVKRYIKKTKDYAGFKKLDIKWSDGTGLDEHGFSLDFPRLSVKAKDEIVSFGAPGELEVGRKGVIGGGKKLKPEEVNALVSERGDDVVFFDGRNKFEADIGKFKNAIVPDVDTTRDFVAELDSGKYDDLKDKPVVTYCTGGIRCEVLSAMMISRGFTEVYQMDGGIVRYGETYGDQGLWEGSLYVFDQRISMDFSPDTPAIGVCVSCETKTSRMQNCENRAECRQQLVVCDNCSAMSIIHCQNCTNSATLDSEAPVISLV